MLHEFLAANYHTLVSRCRGRVATRTVPWPSDGELLHGIPVFLEQLISALQTEECSDAMISAAADEADTSASSDMGAAASQHGRDLLLHGFTVDQVVHDYGDLSHVIAELALEQNEAVTTAEFRVLNGCIDGAIADAVAEYAREREALIRLDGAEAVGERLGLLAHDLRKLVDSAMLAIAAVKRGHVGLGGATAGVLDRTMADLRMLLDRSLADVRLTRGLDTITERIGLEALIADAQIGAQLEAERLGCSLTVMPVAKNLIVEGDRQMLLSAVANLLRNAYQFGGAHQHVWLTVSAAADRVLIEVEDECGGLPPGMVQTLFSRSEPGARERLGVGLSITRRGVEASGGALRVRDVPGTGCVFTIDLPLAAEGEAQVSES